MMRSLIVTLTLSLAVPMHAQDISGFWVFNTPLGGDNRNSYSFDNSEKFFTYRTSRYDGLRSIIYIRGNYAISGDSIRLEVKAGTQIVGGTLSRMSRDTSQIPDWQKEELFIAKDKTMFKRVLPSTNNYWTLKNGKVEPYRYDPPLVFTLSFKYGVDETGFEYIELDGDKFYLWPDPDDESYKFIESSSSSR